MRRCSGQASSKRIVSSDYHHFRREQNASGTLSIFDRATDQIDLYLDCSRSEEQLIKRVSNAIRTLIQYSVKYRSPNDLIPSMKNKITLYSVLLLALSFATVGCYYDNMDTVYPGNGLFTPCDTTSVMSYSTHIVPIMQNNCVSCHTGTNGSAGVQLDTYAGVADAATSTLLIGATWHEAGYTPMPPNYQLDSCALKQLKKWVDAGAPNN